MHPLPATYSKVPPAAVNVKEYSAPKVHGQVSSGTDSVNAALDEAKKWLENVQPLLDQAQMTEDECIS